ncbi:hypothetical protein FRB95_010197 [Tulasnella sp. JGI-2019a]|nr:hypothetical protein FRB95_010197 [Tulasnella sp. JGI-2019a]
MRVGRRNHVQSWTVGTVFSQPGSGGVLSVVDTTQPELAIPDHQYGAPLLPDPGFSDHLHLSTSYQPTWRIIQEENPSRVTDLDSDYEMDAEGSGMTGEGLGDAEDAGNEAKNEGAAIGCREVMKEKGVE